MMKKLISGLVLLAMLACLVLPAAAAEPAALPMTVAEAVDSVSAYCAATMQAAGTYSDWSILQLARSGNLTDAMRQDYLATLAEKLRACGGVLDECILRQAVADLPAREREKVQDVFRRSPTWRSHALYAARRVKEAYFTDEKKYEKEPCVGRVRLYYDGRQEIIFRLTQEFIEKICRQPVPELQNR